MIRVAHLTDVTYMELICSPFEVFPFWVDPINLLSRSRFLELTRIDSLLRGRPVLKFLSFLVIAIGW